MLELSPRKTEEENIMLPNQVHGSHLYYQQQEHEDAHNLAYQKHFAQVELEYSFENYVEKFQEREEDNNLITQVSFSSLDHSIIL